MISNILAMCRDVLVAIACSCFAHQGVADAPVHSYKMNLGSVRISNEAFLEILRHTHSFVQRNSQSTNPPSVQLAFGSEDPKRELEFNRLPEDADLGSLPQKSTDASFICMSSLQSDPVTSASFYFSDVSRLVTISGTSPEHVHMLAGMLNTEWEAHETWMGGPMFRFSLFAGLGLLAAAAATFAWMTPTRMVSLPDAFKILMLWFVVAYVLDWMFGGFFPGTLILSGSSAILDSLSPIATLLGIVGPYCGVLVFIATAGSRRTRQLTSKDNAAPHDHSSQGLDDPRGFD